MCFKIEIREMVSFELGKEMEKDVLCLVTSVGQRKKILSPHEVTNIMPLTSLILAVCRMHII